MKFGIVIVHERRKIRLRVELVAQTKETAQYKVIARNGTVTFQTNKPLLRAKGLKYKPAEWKVIQGGISNQYILKEIIKALDEKTSL